MRMYQHFQIIKYNLYKRSIPINSKWSRFYALSDPNSENSFPKDFLTKLDTYQDYSKTLESAKEKLKNDIRFGK